MTANSAQEQKALSRLHFHGGHAGRYRSVPRRVSSGPWLAERFDRHGYNHRRHCRDGGDWHRPARLIDSSSRKRLFVVVPGVCTVAASALIILSQQFWVVSSSQVVTAIAGAVIGPAVNAITLGIVRQSGFAPNGG